MRAISRSQYWEAARPNRQIKTNQALCLGIKSGRPYFSFFNNDFHPAIELTADWQHITWQYEAATETVRIIVDQLPAQVDEGGHSQFAGSGELYIGRWQDWDDSAGEYTSHHFSGFISEVRIWNSFRSEADVRSTQNQRLNGDEDTLAGYWVFDDVYRSLLTSKTVQDDNLYFVVREFSEDQITPQWQDVDNHPLLAEHLPLEAFAFDGGLQYLATEGVQLSDSAFTLEAWVKTQNEDSNKNTPILWRGKRTGSGRTDFELRVKSDRKVEFRYRQAADPSGADLNVLTSSSAIPLNTFAHVAVIVETTEVRIYINGVKKGGASATTLENRGEILLVGRSEAETDPEQF